MKSQKQRKFHFVPLSTAQVVEYRQLREMQAIAWENRDRKQATKIGRILAEMREANPIFANV